MRLLRVHGGAVYHCLLLPGAPITLILLPTSPRCKAIGDPNKIQMWLGGVGPSVPGTAGRQGGGGWECRQGWGVDVDPTYLPGSFCPPGLPPHHQQQAHPSHQPMRNGPGPMHTPRYPHHCLRKPGSSIAGRAAFPSWAGWAKLQKGATAQGHSVLSSSLSYCQLCSHSHGPGGA